MGYTLPLDPTKPGALYPQNLNGCGSAFDSNMPPDYNPDTYCTPAPFYSPDVKRILAGIMNSIDPMMKTSLGLCGSAEYLKAANTSLAGAYYAAIVAINDTVLDVTAGATNEVDSSGVDVNLAALSGVTLKAGTVLNGIFKKVVVVTGVVKLLPLPAVLRPGFY